MQKIFLSLLLVCGVSFGAVADDQFTCGKVEKLGTWNKKYWKKFSDGKRRIAFQKNLKIHLQTDEVGPVNPAAPNLSTRITYILRTTDAHETSLIGMGATGDHEVCFSFYGEKRQGTETSPTRFKSVWIQF